jgi:hypothetical protein
VNADGYSQFITALADNQIALARTKTRFLSLAKMANAVNGSVPWQVNKLSDSQLEKFKKDPGFQLPPPK